MDMFELLNNIETPEFDYLFLIDLLKDYSSPRDQITKLIRKGWIIRIKKGIYVLGSKFNRPFSKNILANMIYGPSYVSGFWALSFYGLIPERVELVTCKTTQKNKTFKTPVGSFQYENVPLSKYAISINRQSVDEKRYFLIASVEKALSEIICELKETKNILQISDWIDSIRIDNSDLIKLRIGEFENINKVFKSEQIKLLVEHIRRIKKQ